MHKWILLAALALSLFAYFSFRDYRTEVYVSEAEEEHSEALSVPILFVGDIMLGRHVETLADGSKDRLRSFNKIRQFLSQHVTIANLEGTVPLEHTKTPINGFTFSFPTTTPNTLKAGGIAAVSLANNHMFDKGRKGYEETKLALRAGDIAHFGGYSPTADDYFETKIGTTTVIVYGITMIATGWDEEQAVEVTRKLNTEHPDAHLVAFLHWGDEYVTQNVYQRSFAHRLIDSGVDTIIGAHPHVIQGIETYNGKPIFYSLGNFIFDQYWHKDTEKGYMVRMSDAGGTINYELIPVRQFRSIVYVATSTEKGEILSDIRRQSDDGLKDAVFQERLIFAK